jgi:hypothetical protein
MDDLWLAVSPGGIAFTPPTPGDVDDWAPDDHYDPHPAHLIASEDAETAAKFDTTSDEAVHQMPAPQPDRRRKPAQPLSEDAHIEERTTDPSPSSADLWPIGTSLDECAGTTRPPPALVVTARDIEIFRFLARHRMATYDQLALAFNTTTNALRQRLPRLHAVGYLAKRSYGHPAMAVWMVTKDGMKGAGLELPVASFTTVYEHTLGLTDLAIKYARLGITVLTEADIKAAERQGAPSPPGLPRFVSPQVDGSRHRPDLVLYYPTSTPGVLRCVAVELELTRKGPKRLRPLLRAYRRTAGIDEVRYYTPDRDIAKGVANAAKAVGAVPMVTIKQFRPSGKAA